MKQIHIVDTTMRDGMHAMSHQFTPDDMAEIAAALDQAGVPYIEVSHGDGVGGASCQYGCAAASDEDYFKAVAPVLTRAKLTTLLIPGVGTHKDLEMAAKNGVKAVRIATHVTEADIAAQHVRLARELGLEAMTFLMMAHMADVDKVAEQARLFDSYGAEVVYVTDSAGALLPSGIAERVRAIKAAIKAKVGVHTHNNLGLAIGNSLAGVEAGAEYVDGSLCGLGAAAGNAQTEVLACVLEKMNVATGIDLYKIMDAAEDVLRPKMRRPIEINKLALSIGLAGVYGSFMLHSVRAAEKFGVDPRDILIELGRRQAVGGQEDLIIGVASEIAASRDHARP